MSFLAQIWRLAPIKRTVLIGGGVLLLSLIAYGALASSPSNFPVGKMVYVPAGSSVTSVAQLLVSKSIIRNAAVFIVTSKIFGGTTIAGEYSFASAQNVFDIASRLSNGDFKIKPIRVTITEGTPVRDIAQQLRDNIPDFDSNTFLINALAREGYLFPDTYFFFPGTPSQVVMKMFEDRFDQQLSQPAVAATIKASGHTLSELVVMASLLEKEASNTHDRQLIAGVLWNRIKIGMPLQVDAVFPYIMGKNSFDLTHVDLKINSPYNTYIHTGLPPGAIGSPSLDAILAAATPIKSSYIYYLSDRHGTFHFAVTYDQHLANKAKYLGS